MDIFKIALVGIAATIFVVMLKERRPEIAIFISIATGIMIFLFVLSKLGSVFAFLKYFADKAKIDQIYFGTIMKVIAIAYITEFGAQICKDSGEGAIAAKIEFAGKVLIMMLAIPILAALMDIITQIIPS